jgi:putative protease
MSEELIGVVSHYFGKPCVAAIEVTTGEISVGDTIHVVGHTTDFTQTVTEMQVEHEAVTGAQPGDQIGIKVGERARVHDRVFRVN